MSNTTRTIKYTSVNGKSWLIDNATSIDNHLENPEVRSVVVHYTNGMRETYEVAPKSYTVEYRRPLAGERYFDGGIVTAYSDGFGNAIPRVEVPVIVSGPL